MLLAEQAAKHLDAHQPPCANCGMPLLPNSGTDDLICSFCGQRHHFLPPPAPTLNPEFHAGDRVAVEWEGHWWSAHVVEEVLPQQQWRIHFEGWAPAFDDVVTPPRIRAITDNPQVTPVTDEQTAREPQPTTETREMSSVAAAALVLVAILGFAVLWLVPEPLNPPDATIQMNPPGIVTGPVSEHLVTAKTPVPPGQKVHIKWGTNWYEGTALKVDTQSGDITVRYYRWGERFDEVVPRSRIRLVK